MMRLIVNRRPEVCPNCGYSPVGTILYGLPAYSAELERDLQLGRTILGGCCVHPGRVKWACKNCGCEFQLDQSAADGRSIAGRSHG